jgi:hypothetical protein
MTPITIKVVSLKPGLVTARVLTFTVGENHAGTWRRYVATCNECYNFVSFNKLGIIGFLLTHTRLCRGSRSFP